MRIHPFAIPRASLFAGFATLCSLSFGSSFQSSTIPSVTHDVGSNLSEVLETELISQSCDHYWKQLDAQDTPLAGTDTAAFHVDEVRCGKWLFLSWKTGGSLPFLRCYLMQ